MSETHTTSSNGETYSMNNKTLVILWYNLPFYLKSSATYFRANQCKNVGSTCILSTVNSDLNKSGGVIFTHSTLPRTPPVKIESQVWIFNTLENKAFTHKPNTAWDYKFEWIMSYRRDADVSRPYGKIIRLDKSIERNYSEVFRQKTKFGVWMSGHCPVPSRRKEYIEKLQKYIDIDTFGSCGKKKCGVRTPAMNECLKNFSRDYKFYFSFENNICRDYSTEKQKCSRSLTISDILKIHRGYGPVLPIGTPICTSCLVKLSAPSIEEDEDVMTRDITTKTHRQHVINEEPLHDDLSSATAEMDVMVSNQETVKKLKADLNSFIKTAPEGQNEFMQFQGDKN
uniref:Fucosyltransferase n=1 Tax=Magallana gigas TaxID=29159 RepID=A0A8W8IGI4_MAGGI